jgi:integrase
MLFQSIFTNLIIAKKVYMKVTPALSGIQLACDEKILKVQVVPVTLKDLLLLIAQQDEPNRAMLASTSAKFLEFIGRTAETTSIDELKTEMGPFLEHLRSGKYKPNSVKSYRNFVNILIKSAVTAGWSPRPFQVPAVWKPMWDAVGVTHSRKVLRFAIELDRKPGTLSDDDLRAWCVMRAQSGNTLAGARGICSQFRKAARECDLAASLPLITFKKPDYGLSLHKMEPLLRDEILELLAWKVRPFQPNRPRNGRVRPISAKNLSDHLCRIVGYVQNIMGGSAITCLKDLVIPDLIESYATWAVNDRKVQGNSIAAGLTALRAAMVQHPRYKDLDLEWLGRLSRQAPTVPQTAIDGRKAKKFISFAEADEIPSKIRAVRMRLRQTDIRACAKNVRDELLMTWLVILPWRQSNIRKCRIMGAAPNLTKEPIARFSQTKKARWILDQEKLQPNNSFWQFRFSSEETKTKNDVHAYLPFDLIALLEEYLDKHRPVLVGDGEDPGTLFLSDSGIAFDDAGVTNRVAQLVAVHAGRATTPHLFRDIVADAWLEDHPEDYLTISKILWHRNIETTLKRYANRFDESAGVARMDDWRASRRKATA